MVKISIDELVLVAENSALLVILATSKLKGKQISWPKFSVRVLRPRTPREKLKKASPMTKKTAAWFEDPDQPTPFLLDEEDDKK